MKNSLDPSEISPRNGFPVIEISINVALSRYLHPKVHCGLIDTNIVYTLEIESIKAAF